MFVNDSDKFDQHFLIDEKVINKFIKEANLNKKDTVVEIGPGKGQISSLIAPNVKHLTLIELDERLKPYLEELQLKYKNIDIIFSSALDAYIPECDKIITSLPYSIVEPFINKLIKCKFNEILMITGKKYASGVYNKELNKLSIITNSYFTCEYLLDIEPDSFDPKPRVMSSMIRLKPLKASDIKDFKSLMFRFLFYFRDKTLKNALVESLIRSEEILGNVLTQRISKSIINEMNIDEELKNKVFSTLSNNELLIINDLLDNLEKNNDFNTLSLKQ